MKKLCKIRREEKKGRKAPAWGGDLGAKKTTHKKGRNRETKTKKEGGVACLSVGETSERLATQETTLEKK